MGSFLSIAVTLFFIMDALGSIPVYLSLVNELPKRRQLWIAIRELLIALAIMILFHYIGELVLTMLGINAPTVNVSGGLILFLIAIKLIFPDEREEVIEWGKVNRLLFRLQFPSLLAPLCLQQL